MIFQKNKTQKNNISSPANTLMRLLIVSGVIFFNIASAQAMKVAMLDKEYVFNNFSLVQDSLNTIQGSRERVQRLITTADTEIQKLEEDKKIKPEQVEQRRAEIQRILDQEVLNLQNEQVDLRAVVERKFREEIDKVALEKKYDVIFDKAYVVDDAGSVPDITQEFLKRLEKNKK